MDMLPAAAADALPRGPTAAEYPVRTAANEDAYYAQHTLNFTVPAWVPAVSALLRSFRAAPGPLGAPRHA